MYEVNQNSIGGQLRTSTVCFVYCSYLTLNKGATISFMRDRKMFVGLDILFICDTIILSFYLHIIQSV